MEKIEFEEFLNLLNRGELKGLDFKRDQYRLDDDRTKSKFIKDILAMANTVQPPGEKYIILGVYYYKGQKDMVGIKESRDDEEFQSIIRDKVYPIPDFLYEEIQYQGKQFGVITIYERKNKPHKPIRDYGVLKKDEISIRRGSKNDIATIDEVTEIYLSNINERLKDILEPITELTRREIKKTCVFPKLCENALKTLKQKHLLILLGPPHIGKSFVGQYLLIRLKEENLINEISKFSEYQEYWKLKSLEGHGIFMDDPFGGAKFEGPSIGKHFDEIINLSKLNNFVVITSRSNVFGEAKKQTKMGEKRYLDDYIFELEEGSYTEDEREIILENHLDYSFSVEKEITKDKYDFAKLNKKTIISSLHFPHNIERLVSLLKEKDTLNLASLIDQAKEIEKAAGLWFDRLEEEKKYFVFAVALFNGRFEEEGFKQMLENIFSALRINKPVWSGQLRRATKSYITEQGKIAFKHESYLEGILSRIRDDNYGYYRDRFLALSHFFQSLVKNGDPYIRLSASFPLGELAHVDQEKAFFLTTELLRDGDFTVREYAIFPLKEIAKVNYDRVSELISEISEVGGPIQKQQIAFLFKEIGHERPNEAISILERLIKETKAEIWRAAAYSLATIDKKYSGKVLEIINNLASERDIRLRKAAAICIRDMGKVDFGKEIKSIISKLVFDKVKGVRYTALRSLIEIGYEKPREIFDLAIKWSKESQPIYKVKAAQIIGEIGIVVNRSKAILLLESLTKDNDSSVRNFAKKILLMETKRVYTFEKLKAQVQSLIDGDQEKISQTLADLTEKSLPEDFNKAVMEVLIRPHIDNGDVEGLRKTLSILSATITISRLVRNTLVTIFQLYEKNEDKALSFVLKWYEIDKAMIISGFYQILSMRSFTDSKGQFIANSCKEICRKNGDCNEVFEPLDKWISIEKASSERKRRLARLLVLILREIGSVFIDPVINLLQKWSESGGFYRLNIITAALIEIAQFEQNKDKAHKLLRHLLDEDKDITIKAIFYAFRAVGERKPEKVLPVLKELASYDKLNIRQEVSMALGRIGKAHPEITINRLREWINDRELLKLETIPYALQSIFWNNKWHDVLVSLERWRVESKNKDVHQVVNETYKRLEKELPEKELKKKLKKIREEIFREKISVREEKIDMTEIKELPLLSYLSKIETERALEKYIVILLQHLLGDFARFIPALERVGISPENTFILGIPYSTKSSIVFYLTERKYLVSAPCEYPFIQDVNKVIKESIKKAKEKDKRVLIIEDGGYIVPLLHEEYLDDINWFKGAVEQTANGIWRDKELEQKKILKIPVMNVAECPLKQLIESPLVGEAVVRNLSNLLARIGKGIGGKEILIVGYGNVGKQIADTLKRNKAITYVYDFDKIKLLQARNDGHITKGTLNGAVQNKFAIIGGTGREVVNKDIILLLDHNTHLINATSKRVEINIDELNALTVTSGVNEIGDGAAQVHKLINERDIILMAKGFPVNFYGEAESIPDADIQFVPGLLFKGILELARSDFGPGIYDIPEKIRQEIANLQLKLKI